MDEFRWDRRRRRGPFRVVAAIIMGIFVAALISFITAVFVMLLWNWLMPAIFGLGAIGYWQAFGLSLLAKLLLGGFAKPFPGPHRWRDRRFNTGSPKSREAFWGVNEFDEHLKSCRGWRFDDVYEDWWENEGSKSFEEYIKKDGKSGGEEKTGSEEK